MENELIERAIKRLREVHTELDLEGEVTARLIKDRFLGRDAKQQQNLLLDVFKDHNQRFLERVTVGDAANASYTKYKSVYSHVEKFMIKEYGKSLSVKYIDTEFIEKFHLWQ